LRLAQAELKSANSWVMTSPGGEGFVKLPNERILYTSPQRTSLQISTPNPFPGSQPFTAKSDAGVVYITNQRIVYLPTSPTPELQSFSSPILNLQDTHVRAPFFGANFWTGLCKPVPEGGIPTTHSAVELRLTFKDGGAFDFHTIFEQIKERAHDAYTAARENGQRGAAALADVHLEQLPAYEPTSQAPSTPPASQAVERETQEPAILSPIPRRPSVLIPGVAGTSGLPETPSAEQQVPPPDGPPPGYEEAQMHAVEAELDRRFRQESGRT